MIQIKKILQFVEELNIPHKYCGDINAEIEGFCPLRGLRDYSMTWARHVEDIEEDKMREVQGILLLADITEEKTFSDMHVLWVENPHRTFFKVLDRFFGNLDPDKKGSVIENSSIVETEHIGEHVYIGHQCYIGKDVMIGDDVKILHHVTIQGRVEIGNHTIIESGTVIGSCGYGFYDDVDGNHVCVPHLGGVKIGNHVKIGANNCISRGCLDDTILEDYVKTDNLCHIAHNDCIKRGAMLTAGVVIAGSTTVGENAWLAPGSVLKNKITVEKNGYLGLGAVAIADVPENKVVVGIPAKVLRERQ